MVSLTFCSFPSLRTVSSTSSPAACSPIKVDNVPAAPILIPSTAVIMSFFFNPAFSAGPPGIIAVSPLI